MYDSASAAANGGPKYFLAIILSGIPDNFPPFVPLLPKFSVVLPQVALSAPIYLLILPNFENRKL